MTDFAYELLPDRAPQIGLIVLQNDESVEMELHRMLPPELELLISRVPSGRELLPETIETMAGTLTGAAALFPDGLGFAAVGYACTSGTAQLGAGRVAGLVRAGVPAEKVSEPVSALIAACRALGVSRIGLISPYVASVSERLRQVLGQAGIEVAAFGSFNEPQEARVVRISPASIYEAAHSLGERADIEALFLSCTNLRTLDVIDGLEAALGFPVLSSNQVLAWHMFALAGGYAPSRAPGCLWSRAQVEW